MRKIIALVLIMAIALPVVFCIETHNANYVIEQNTVEVRHLIKTKNGSVLQMKLPSDAHSFLVLKNGKPGNFSLKRFQTYKEIKIPWQQKTCLAELSYKTSQFIEHGQNSYFVASLDHLEANKLSVSLKLPPDRLLARPISAATPPVNPYPDSVQTDGRQIVINWSKNNTKDSFSMFVAYERKEFSFKFFIFASLFVLIIVASLFFIGFLKHKSSQVYSHLLEQEQTIIETLTKAKDKIMWQKELQIKVGFTKSKLSRTIKNLEKRGLVKKIPYGATNKIELINENRKH